MPLVKEMAVPDPAIDCPVLPSTSLVPTRATNVSAQAPTLVGGLAALAAKGNSPTAIASPSVAAIDRSSFIGSPNGCFAVYSSPKSDLTWRAW